MMISHLAVILLLTVPCGSTRLKHSQRDASTAGYWAEDRCLYDYWDRALKGHYSYDDQMTRTLCQNICQGKGYNIAGLENGNECFCANQISLGESNSGRVSMEWECSVPCRGDPSQTCGGPFRIKTFTFVRPGQNPSGLSLYSSSIKATSVKSSTKTSTAKVTSTKSSATKSTTTKSTSTSSPKSVSSVKSNGTLSTMPTSSKAVSKNGPKKAGLAWNLDSGSRFTDFTRAPGSVVGWTYNWGTIPVTGTPVDQLEFVPMAWGSGSVAGFGVDSARFPSFGVKNLLSFNEPDQGWQVGGCNMSPVDAAKYHQMIFNSTLASEYRIGSPEVARGGKWWMQQWIAACGGRCKYDFIPIHFYGNNAGDMVAYIKDFLVTFGKPVWVTEYACMDFGAVFTVCNLDQTKAFQKEVIHYMYHEPMVERYAAFGTFKDMAANGNANGMLNLDGTPNELGLLYASAT